MRAAAFPTGVRVVSVHSLTRTENSSRWEELKATPQVVSRDGARVEILAVTPSALPGVPTRAGLLSKLTLVVGVAKEELPERPRSGLPFCSLMVRRLRPLWLLKRL